MKTGTRPLDLWMIVTRETFWKGLDETRAANFSLDVSEKSKARWWGRRRLKVPSPCRPLGATRLASIIRKSSSSTSPPTTTAGTGFPGLLVSTSLQREASHRRGEAFNPGFGRQPRLDIQAQDSPSRLSLLSCSYLSGVLVWKISKARGNMEFISASRVRDSIKSIFAPFFAL